MADTNNEQSQLLDDEVVPEEFPPEQPYGVNERLTPREEQGGESFDERTRRERPDRLGEDAGRVGTLVAPDGGEGFDDEADEVATEIDPPLRRDQLDAGTVFDRDMAQDKEEVIPAEEAAMHITDEPPMGDGDGYLDD
jgi:hypothetical protein